MINDPTAIITALRSILANTALLYLKTHQYHHNVTGVNFYASHAVFNTQYEAFVDAIDKLGERLRQLGANVPVTDDYFVLGNIRSSIVGASEFTIYKDLATDNMNIANQCIRAALIAQDLGDTGSAEVFSGRQLQHQDFAWKLTSMLPQSAF
jgi:starvation-inducible DNA-binding protein